MAVACACQAIGEEKMPSIFELSSWDILREPNRILYEDDYRSWSELLIYFLTWSVEIGLFFVIALNYLRR